MCRQLQLNSGLLMIKCTFIYMFSTGGASDSLRDEFEVQAVPRVGEQVLIGPDGPGLSVVKRVLHHLSTDGGASEIHVYYTDDQSM